MAEEKTADKKTAAHADTRAERLKAALRANLRRRKVQERGRAEGEPGEDQRDEGPQGR